MSKMHNFKWTNNTIVFSDFKVPLGLTWIDFVVPLCKKTLFYLEILGFILVGLCAHVVVLLTVCPINCAVFFWCLWTVMFFRSSHSQAGCRGTRETNRPYSEDRRGHCWHPPLRHHFLRSGSPHEEEVCFLLLDEITLAIFVKEVELTYRVLTNEQFLLYHFVYLSLKRYYCQCCSK